MLKRLWVSLFHPKQLTFFLKDKIGKVLFYLFTMIFVAIIPSILYIFLVSPITPSLIQNIESAFIIEAPDCSITNNTLQCQNDSSFIYKEVTISFLERVDSYTNQFVFERDALVFYTASFEVSRYAYADLGLTNIDLKLTDSASQQAFATTLTKLYNELGYLYQISNIIANYISQIIIVFVMVFIISMTYGLRIEKLKFQYRFIFASYSMTAYLVSLFIAQLYGFEFIIYVGMILPYIFMDQAYRGLISMSKIVIKKDDDHHE